MAPAQHSPTVRGRRLARELKTRRERAGLTLDQAAAALGWNRFKLGRMEAGKTRATAADVERVLDLYGTEDAARAVLLQLARDAGRRGWWTAYSGVFTGGYVALENEASEIRTYHVQLIPGLLQTEDYARAVISAGVPEDPDEVNKRLHARLARKTLLSRSDAPSLRAVLAESALRQLIGGRQVMRDQLIELDRIARRPNVALRALPYSVGARAGVEGSFVILGYADPLDPDIGYSEGIYGNVYIEGADHVARCNAEFDAVWNAALDDEESKAFIAAIAAEL
ncbi:helix-turn-helix transcriptional regulator [Spirillospora sp. NPDC029432]|uniref:helix-turn-helix domain-containing protein n=1 Tax=Spirillospora sp. NPDC029432 TaxID=3154599 RepID=UPI003452B633